MGGGVRLSSCYNTGLRQDAFMGPPGTWDIMVVLLHYLYFLLRLWLRLWWRWKSKEYFNDVAAAQALAVCGRQPPIGN